MIIYAISLTLMFVALTAYSLTVYNRMMRLTNVINEAWANIATALMKRHDTIPKLAVVVKTSKDYEALVQLSQAEIRSNNITGVSNAEQNIQKSILGIKEAYPELKTSSGFETLMAQLIDIENDIQGSRLLYNRAAALYNMQLQQFPGNIFVLAFGYSKAEFFEVDPAL